MKLRKRTRDTSLSRFLSVEGVKFFSTGCTLLDCALGGGWALGRVTNLIGDRSTGKTLLLIEAETNFIQQYPKGLIRHKEAEAAFNVNYAQLLGMPVDKVDFAPDFNTVEEFHRDLSAFAAKCAKRKQPGLYALDSLDALSDAAEMERDPEKGSYGAKAKLLSEMFRRLVKKLEAANVTLFIISQTRDNIGVTFGRKWTRSGGKALDFYASQIVYLAEIEKIRKTFKGAQRITGVKIRALVDKNKCGLPFRQVDFPIKFGYGVDDRQACSDFLEKVVKMRQDKLENVRNSTALIDQTKKHWLEIETHFLPSESKYG